MALVDLSFLDIGAKWPPPSEVPRLETYNANRKLFEGRHEEVFRDWPRLLRQDNNATLEMILNWPKRLSTLWADLVAGDPPSFALGDEAPEQEQLDDLLERTQFSILIYDVVIDISRYGHSVFKICKKDGLAYIEGQAPDYWFPVQSISNASEVVQHVLAWPFEAIDTSPGARGRTRGEKVSHVKVEIHTRGQIQHRVLVLDKTQKIDHYADPRLHFATLPPNGIEYTGIDEFLVQDAPGMSPIGRLHGVDDYKDAESIVQEMEMRLAQVARILDKHADPSMYGPESALEINRVTGEATFRGGGKYFPVADQEEPPG